eukprot:5507215-Amphidinium_carterae.2
MECPPSLKVHGAGALPTSPWWQHSGCSKVMWYPPNVTQSAQEQHPWLPTTEKEDLFGDALLVRGGSACNAQMPQPCSQEARRAVEWMKEYRSIRCFSDSHDFACASVGNAYVRNSALIPKDLTTLMARDKQNTRTHTHTHARTCRYPNQHIQQLLKKMVSAGIMEWQSTKLDAIPNIVEL